MSPRRAPTPIALAVGGILVSGTLAAYAAGDRGAIGAASFDPLLGDPVLCLSGSSRPQALRYGARLAQLAQSPRSPELRPVDRPQMAPTPDDESVDPPLWAGLGALHYKITTRSPAAQQYFDQGLRLSHAFNHGEARRAFRAAQKRDPDCAMCYWGEALVLGPNINAPMSPDAVAPAMAALTKAQQLAPQASVRERALIEALATRYTAQPPTDRAALDAAYAEAMASAHRRFPQDTIIATLYAEAMMDTQPWDYWQPGGAQPKGHGAEIVQVLERVLKAHPDHPGAIHLYIHAVEASNRPGRAESHAERLEKLMPGAGHIVHMPSHIYYRVGRYIDSLAANKRAVATDEAYLSKSKAEGIYAWGYYPHNVHFLMASAQMAGDGPTAVAAAEKLSAVIPDEALRDVPLVHPVKVAAYFAHAQFSDPATVLALPDPGDDYPYIKAIWHYARGTAHAAAGDIPAARAEADAIARLNRESDFKALEEALIPVPQVLRIAEQTVRARAAQAAGDLPQATRHFRAAIAAQEHLAYMEPPYWYYPLHQSLGAVLLAQGDLDGAEQAFRTSLVRAPNNGWALYGLTQVLEKRGDRKQAAAMQQRFQKAWAGKAEVDLARL